MIPTTRTEKPIEPLTLFIGGLPGEITHREVHGYFSALTSEEVSVYLKFKKNGLCAGHGILKLKDSCSYAKIKNIEHVISGRQIECRPYYTSSSFSKVKDEFQNCRVYVTKIPTSVTDFELKRIFECVGKVVKAYIIRKGKEKKAYDFGYVVFKNQKDAEKAVEMREFAVKGKTILCKKFTPKDQSNNENKVTENNSGSFETKEERGERLLSDSDIKTLLSKVAQGEKLLTNDQLEMIKGIFNIGEKDDFLKLNKRKEEKVEFREVRINKKSRLENLKEVHFNHFDQSNIRFNRRF